jgi:hypothetical protein
VLQGSCIIWGDAKKGTLDYDRTKVYLAILRVNTTRTIRRAKEWAKWGKYLIVENINHFIGKERIRNLEQKKLNV